MPDSDDNSLLPLTGLPDPPKREWRKYTAALWEQHHPEQAEYCLHLVREELILSVSELARRIGKEFDREPNGGFRNIIMAYLARKLTPAERDALQQAKLYYGRAQLIDQTLEVADKAHSKSDLGALSMAMKLVHDVNQIVSGGATRITGKTSDAASKVESFKKKAQERLRQQAASAIEVESQLMPVPKQVES